MLLLNHVESSACCRAVGFQRLLRAKPELFELLLSHAAIRPPATRVIKSLVSMDDSQLAADELELAIHLRKWHENNLRLGLSRRRLRRRRQLAAARERRRRKAMSRAAKEAGRCTK